MHGVDVRAEMLARRRVVVALCARKFEPVNAAHVHVALALVAEHGVALVTFKLLCACSLSLRLVAPMHLLRAARTSSPS